MCPYKCFAVIQFLRIVDEEKTIIKNKFFIFTFVNHDGIVQPHYL